MRKAVQMAIGAALLGLGTGCGPTDPGERVYLRKCAACHGLDGAARTRYGETHPYANLTDGVWRHGGDPVSIRRLISEGDPKSPMPPFRGRLDEAEIEAVARYVENLTTTPRRKPSPR
jgi:mono/diheme cytochrome c family protein